MRSRRTEGVALFGVFLLSCAGNASGSGETRLKGDEESEWLVREPRVLVPPFQRTLTIPMSKTDRTRMLAQVVVPTAPRQNGQDFLPVALESVISSVAARALQEVENTVENAVETMVMHDRGEAGLHPDLRAGGGC